MGTSGVRLMAVAVVVAVVAVTSGAGVAAEGDDETEYGRMMLVLDSSGSMKESAGGQSKIAAAKAALGRVIDELPDDADVGLRVFGAEVFSRSDQGACQDSQQVVRPSTGNRAELRSAVRNYAPYGETPIPAALQGAAEDIGAEGRRSIVLVSDGESTCGDPCPVAKEIAGRGIDLQVDVVGLSVSGKARQQLQCIADLGGGTYYDAEDADEIAESLTLASTRALRPFEAQGTPVEGTPTSTEAPVIGPGIYVDDFPTREQTRHYWIERTADGSTLRAGIAGVPGELVQYGMSLATPSGDQCGSDAPANNDQVLLSGDLTSVNDTYDACQDADRLVLAITVRGWGQDVPPNTPMELQVSEEPAVPTIDGLPAPVDDFAWTDPGLDGEYEQVEFGTTFAGATEIGPGRYRSSIVPDEVHLYEVPVDWGQSLHALARLHAVPGASATTVHSIQVSILGPTLGDAGYTSAEDESGNLLSAKDAVTGSEEAIARAVTAPVRYLNRGEGELVNLDGASVAGDYYIAVTMDANTAGEDEQEVPYDLEAGLVGEAGVGAPDYDGGATIDNGTSETDEAAPTSDDAGADAGAADDGSGGALTLVAGIGAAGLGVVAIGGAALLLVRRRR